MLNLSAIAHWEAAVLASIGGATGTFDERDAQITRSGMYAEYPAILRSYIDLIQMREDNATRLEALKRAVFLSWYAFVDVPVNTGLAELPESDVRTVMEELASTIAAERGDEELRAMLAWYRDAFGYVFEHFGPVRSLDEFIRELSSEDAVRSLRASSFNGRGQLGCYWAGVIQV